MSNRSFRIGADIHSSRIPAVSNLRCRRSTSALGVGEEAGTEQTRGWGGRKAFTIIVTPDSPALRRYLLLFGTCPGRL